MMFHICNLENYSSCYRLPLLKEMTSPQKALFIHTRKMTTQALKFFSIRMCLQSTSLLAVQRSSKLFKTTLCITDVHINQFDNIVLFAILRRSLLTKRL